ncbi:uncharacterized protein A4U43_C04F24360 [Asparagus officinalis]|uniref:Uncharacterized protein n=1 Tax=Asparagus officinalis TaxID=4686 RepID=A0A5P1F8P3_ASPOF|nr:uncharacterized protein A4U43_C04F24360 [Asparagus officinalis]
MNAGHDSTVTRFPWAKHLFPNIVYLADMCFLYVSKEPIPLDHYNLVDEEKVDYKADTDTYLTKPDDAGFEGNIGGSTYMLDDESGLENGSGATLYLFLLVASSSSVGNSSTTKRGARTQVGRVGREWDLKAAELQAEMVRLDVVRAQAAPLHPLTLRERVHKDALEVRDSRIAECILVYNLLFIFLLEFL